jgi:hypothetical protein
MRTTFSEMHLSNDDSWRHNTSFIFNRKEWGVGRVGERERERQRCGALLEKGCGMGHKLDSWSCIYEGLETDFIKMNIRLIPRI